MSISFFEMPSPNFPREIAPFTNGCTGRKLFPDYAGKSLSLAPTLCGATHSSGEDVPATPPDAAVAGRTRETAKAQTRFAVRHKRRSSDPSVTAPDTHPSPRLCPGRSRPSLCQKQRIPKCCSKATHCEKSIRLTQWLLLLSILPCYDM